MFSKSSLTTKSRDWPDYIHTKTMQTKENKFTSCYLCKLTQGKTDKLNYKDKHFPLIPVLLDTKLILQF